MKFSQYLIVFFMGYFMYCLFEISTRGYTHWTMGITGGFILSVLYVLNSRNTVTLMKSCFFGSVFITLTEFFVGIFDNIIMHWKVWDYTDMPFNLMGQICLPFSCLWFILCVPVYFICRELRHSFTKKGFD